MVSNRCFRSNYFGKKLSTGPGGNEIRHDHGASVFSGVTGALYWVFEGIPRLWSRKSWNTRNFPSNKIWPKSAVLVAGSRGKNSVFVSVLFFDLEQVY